MYSTSTAITVSVIWHLGSMLQWSYRYTAKVLYNYIVYIYIYVGAANVLMWCLVNVSICRLGANVQIGSHESVDRSLSHVQSAG